MRKKIALITGIIITFIIIFIFVFSFQIVEQTIISNSKDIDHGSLTLRESDSNIPGTYTWKTYAEGPNNVTVQIYSDFPVYNLEFYTYIHIQKVDNNTLKLYGTQTCKNSNSHTSNTGNYDTKYVSTNLTAIQYYWENIRPGISGELASKGSSIGGSINGSGTGSSF